MPTHALLFVDQVDSTRQLAQIGDDAMVAVRRRLQDLLTSSVEGHDGRVFGNTGDGIAAVFDSAADAGAAALDMRDRAATTHQGPEPPIHLRIGVHHGEVIPNGQGFIGMAVHLTARLCDLAPADHIAASEAFARAAAGDDRFGVVSYQRRVVKGLTEPIDVHLVTGHDDAAPMPRREQITIPSTPWLDERSAPRRLVGRDATITALCQLAEDAELRCQLALVRGESGIGKSTLLRRVGAHLVATGHVGLVGRSDENHQDAYREFAEALAHLVGNAPEALLIDHALRHGDVVFRLLPGLRHRLPSSVSEAEEREPDAYRLFEAITDLLSSIAAHQPLVLLLDDLQWSSPPSLDLIRHLVRSVDLRRILVIASFRTESSRSDDDLRAFLATIGREPNVHRFGLEPLTSEDVAQLVADAIARGSDAGSNAPPDAEQLRRRTAGSPLFISEILRSYQEGGETTRLTDGSLAVPDTVQELAMLRVDQLGPSHRAVLTDAAVLGVTFDPDDVEALVATDPENGDLSVLDILEDAERAGLVEANAADDGRSMAFHHAVIRDALYEHINPIRRRRRHDQAADVILRTVGDSPGARAAESLRHIDRSARRRPAEEMIELAEAAAEDAMRRISLGEAIHYRSVAVDAHRQAVPHPNASAGVAEALLALAGAQTAAGMAEGRSTYVEAAAVAQAAGRWDLVSAAAVGYGGELKENQANPDITEPVALIGRALPHEPDPTPMRARLLTSIAVWQRQHVPYAARRALVDEALTIARSVEEPTTLAAVLADFYRALHGPNVTVLAWEMSDELERLAAQLADDDVALQALNLRLHAAFELGDTTELDRVIEQLDRLAQRIGNIEGKRISLLWQATHAGMRGDEAGVSTTSSELDALITDYPEVERRVMLAAINLILPWFRGESGVLYEFGRSFAPPAALAFLAADAGRLDDAVAHVEERGGPAAVEDDQNYLFFFDFVAMTRVAVRRHDETLARQVYEIGAPLRGRNARVGLVTFLGAVDHHLGSLAAVMGRWDEAIAHYQAALTRHARMGARPFEALTAAELANAIEADRNASVSSADTIARHRNRARSIADELSLALVHELL